MARLPRRLATALTLLLSACVAESATDVLDPDVAFDIVDGANGGAVEGFYWLTPTVKKNQKNFSGTFDPNFLTLSPTIQICKINGTTGDGFDACELPVLKILDGGVEPEAIILDLLDGNQNYQSTWQTTNGNDFRSGMTYRAVLSVGEVVLGWVDLMAVAKQKDLRRVPAGYSGFVVGSPFIFKFRVETGIAGQVVVPPPGHKIFDANTSGESVNYTATVTDLYANPLPGKTVDWDSDMPTIADVAAASTGPTDGAGQSSNTVSSDGLTPVASNTNVTITATVGAASGSETLLLKLSKGTLEVIKNSGSDGTFDFTGSGDIGGAFQISTTSEPAATGMESFNLLHTSTYDVTETPLNADFDFTSAACKLEGGGDTGMPGGTGVTGIVIEPSKTTTCTFTNALKPGSLKVIKNSDVNGTFDFTGSGGVGGAFQLTTDGEPAATKMTTFTGLDAAVDIDLTETPNPAFTFESAVCKLADNSTTGSGGPAVTGIDIEPGKQTTCTFTNTQKLGSLTVTKNSDANGMFDFTGSGGIGGAFQLVTVGAPTATFSQTFGSLDPNVTYSVTETLNPEFNFVSAVCKREDNSTTGSGGPAVTGIVLEPGKTTTCTFVNDQKPATIKVVKNSGADGSFDFTGSGTIGGFTLETTGSPAATKTKQFEVDAGMTYDITEDSHVGFSFTSVACTLQGGGDTGTPGAATVTGVGVEPGKTTTCTFVNTELDDAPSVGSTTPADLATDVPVGGNIIINFSEAVNATTSSFTIECAAPGNLQTYALSASPSSTFTLDPNADLPATTTCTVTVIAAQTTDADAIDPPDNMAGDFTFSFTTAAAPPVGDSYDVIGNVGINVPDGAGDLNSNDPGAGDVTGVGADVVAPFDGTTTAGGSVSVNANGSFTYDPPAGFEGPDGFDYTTASGSATVALNVADVIWFIDASAGAGDGTLTTPFNSLTGYAGAADDPDDIIFVRSGSYTGNITLQASQILIGEGATASIATIATLTPPTFSNALPSTGGTRPVITNAGGNGISVATGNVIRGLNVGNTSGTGIIDSGGTVGTLTIGDVSITGTGRGFEADQGGNLSVTFDNLSSTNAQGIDIAGANGAFGVTTGAINSGTATAVSISGVPTLTLGVNLISVSASGAANGIVISTTSGTFAVTGTGAAGSGGTIQNTTGDGVSLTSTSGISLNHMNITNPGGDGIEGINLGGTNTLASSSISDIDGADHGIRIDNASTNGTLTISDTDFNDTASPGNGDDAIHFVGTGTSNMTLNVSGNLATSSSIFEGWGGNTIQAGGKDVAAGEDVDVVVNITGTRFQNAPAGGNSSINLQPARVGSMTYDIDGNIFSDMANGPLAAAGVINIRCDDSSFSSGHITNNTIVDVDGLKAIDAIADDNCQQFDIEISNNTIDDTFVEGIRLFLDGLTRTAAGITANVTISGNDIGISQPVGTSGQEGIEIRAFRGLGSAASQMNLLMHNNRVTVNNLNDAVDIDVETDDVMHATITNNTFNNLQSAFDVAFGIESEKGTGAASTMCLNMTGNTTTSGEVHVEEEIGTTFSIFNNATIVAGNPGMTITFLPNFAAFANAASCTLPTLPTP
jgi:hypothetical protein